MERSAFCLNLCGFWWWVWFFWPQKNSQRYNMMIILVIFNLLVLLSFSLDHGTRCRNDRGENCLLTPMFSLVSHLFNLLKDLRENSDCFYSTESVLMNKVSIIIIHCTLPYEPLSWINSRTWADNYCFLKLHVLKLLWSFLYTGSL